MTTPDTLPVADRRRAATILLGCMDDDGSDTITATLDEAYAAPGGLQGLIAPLALVTLELLIGAVGEERARAALTEYLCRAPNADHRRAATLLAACMDDDGADTVGHGARGGLRVARWRARPDLGAGASGAAGAHRCRRRSQRPGDAESSDPQRGSGFR